MSMVSASCHCGAVRFEAEEPEWVLDCNCSHCRLYGGLWAYYPQREVRFASPPDTFIYMWGDRELEFHHCRTCGCATHTTQAGTDDAERIAVNVRLMRGLDPSRVRLVQKNNGNDGVFWTKSDSPVLPSHDAPQQCDVTNRPVHFEIHASDPDKSIAFYQALFGWKFERYPVPGVYYGVITGDETSRGINGGLLQRMGPPPAEGAAVNSWTVTVDVESVDKTMAKALELGGTQALPKMAIPHVGYVAYIKDVDGNIVGLHQNDPGAR